MPVHSESSPSVSFRVEKEARGFRLTLYVHLPGKPEMACAHIDGLSEEEAQAKKLEWERRSAERQRKEQASADRD